MKKILIDTACAQCQQWASCLLDVWSGASIIIVLAFCIYQAWQSHQATRNSPVKQFVPGVALSEYLRAQKNLDAVVAEVEINLKDYDDAPATIRLRVIVHVQKNERVCQ